MKTYFQLLLFNLLLLSACKTETIDGKLFIIGGGYVNESMRDKMIEETGVDKEGYVVVLPMASEEEPLENIQETMDIFKDTPEIKIYGFNIQKGDIISNERLDSIRNAKIVFMSGGDQSRFLEVIEGTQIKQAIFDAYHNGSLIAGTSAGASVMSEVMVTGNELKYPNKTDNFETLEANNVETIQGLGLIKSVTIDQHFIIRKRLNRMISYSIENPNHLCVGIDEATAIYVEGNTATVYGVSQVVVLRNDKAKSQPDLHHIL